MRRRLFNLAAVVSLVFCLATAALWARSYWRRYDITLFMPDARCYTVSSYRGGCYLWTEPAHSQRWQWSSETRPADPHPTLDHPDFDLIGFGFTHNAQAARTWAFYLVRLPQWLLVMVFGGTGFFCLRKRQHLEVGLCRSCGYDLRATPDRCPECGTTPVAVPKAPPHYPRMLRTGAGGIVSVVPTLRGRGSGR